MGQKDLARSEVTAARARMTDIAVELAHRAEPDHLKEIARDKAEDLKVMARDKAVDLKEMAKDKAREQLDEMKDLAKEKAMQKTHELKDQFAASRSRPYVGAAIGASVGWLLFQKLLGSRSAAKQRRLASSDYTERSYAADTGYIAEGGYSEDFYGVDQPAPSIIASSGSDFSEPYIASEGPGIGYESYESGSSEAGLKERASGAVSGAKDRAAGAVSNAKDKASDAVHSAADKASDAVSNMKHKASDAVHSAADKAQGALHSAKQRAGDIASNVPQMQRRGAEWYARTVQEQPLIFALGAVALGMVASALIPVSNRERQFVAPKKAAVMEPAITKAKEALKDLGEKAEQALGGGNDGQQASSLQSAQPSATERPQHLTEDPMAEDKFALGIPDPQTYPTH